MPARVAESFQAVLAEACVAVLMYDDAATRAVGVITGEGEGPECSAVLQRRVVLEVVDLGCGVKNDAVSGAVRATGFIVSPA